QSASVSTREFEVSPSGRQFSEGLFILRRRPSKELLSVVDSEKIGRLHDVSICIPEAHAARPMTLEQLHHLNRNGLPYVVGNISVKGKRQAVPGIRGRIVSIGPPLLADTES